MKKIAILPVLCALLLAAQPGVVCAQLAYSGPPAATWMQKAQQLQAAGDKAGAAAAYQQAYAAYMSVDDSDGMKAAPAGKGAVGAAASRPALAARPATQPAAAPTRAMPAPAPRPAVLAATVAQPLAGSVNSGRPAGLFFMTKHWFATGSTEKSTYYFAPNGQVYVNPTGFSASALAALPPNARGSYRAGGGQLSISWANGGQPESGPIEPQANSFAWDTGLFLAGRPFASAQQLVGSFEGGNSISTSSGNAAVSSGLTFRADGSYSGGSASTFTNTGEGSTAHAGASGSASGRWSLAGWLLTLTDATGRPATSVAFPVETDNKTGQVTRFYFNNVAYKRL